MEVTIAKGMTKEECERAVDKNLNTPNLRFMMEKMAEAGCPIDRSFFTVDDCKEHEGKVVACHNELMSEDDVGSMMMHELIHAYDHCRGKSLEWTNCVHHACSEIRAANLSGDCHMWKELARGHINIAGQGVRCVKRRAELSVAMNPFCQRPGQARRAVDTAFPMCYPDTAPFDRAYH